MHWLADDSVVTACDHVDIKCGEASSSEAGATCGVEPQQDVILLFFTLI